MEYSWFVSTIVKKNSDNRLDVFLWRHIGAKIEFSKLRNVFSMLLILSHRQAQVELRFSTNKLLLDVNMQNKTLVAQRIVHDHVVSENMKPQDLQITKRLMELVKDTRKSYFLHLKEKGLKKLKADAVEKREKINDEIEDTNHQIKLLKETVAKLKADGDKYSFEAEKKTSTASTLKRAAVEKQELTDKLSAKKRCLIKKRLIFKFATILNSLSPDHF